MLTLRNVNKTYRQGSREIRVLVDTCLDVRAGEFVVVRGPSGCGKTTLLLTAGGLLSPDEGKVSVDGHEPYRLSPNDRAAFRATNVGFVFQQFHLVPYLDVLENILAAAMASATPDARGRAVELMERFGLADRANHLPGQLSTGERQRTALARAMLNRPKLILADEPTGNLDQANSDIVLACLADFANQQGAVLLVTHSTDTITYADRTLVLNEGRVREV